MVAVGQCIIRFHRNSETDANELHVDHADPYVHIATEVIDKAIFHPDDMFWVDFSAQQTCFDDHEHDKAACFALRSVLHIKGVNREVLYRITPHPDRADVYQGHWPD
ncbi:MULTISPECIES: hypothetical protein [Mycolicibacterium]|uniref:Uncharacterized protein n=2 Tax=Mycolicibacterium TaxID=1866885 RepID=A0AAE4VCM5_MYCFO|nr:hypothetical protein [Mycolicibacterium fortuitum]MDV7192566.1 hypothetical protein [Mycolicibacterium fortuitum]MDV7205467.1 hypothetical protein [Mycolicibacterium fortuitum]MDV7227048.1 hypothetical protein [Mycolicibacterium fortuitum]MDV7259707.1 hypothetical protein [Mycolicibacterium fortuitum]MDV7286270.1 hypothetical protein [Mycolicibacterium fortuitum]